MASVKTTTVRLHTLTQSHVSGDGNTITVSALSPNGSAIRITLSPEIAGVLMGGLRDACNKAHAYRTQGKPVTRLEDHWSVSRAFVAHPVPGVVRLHLDCNGVRQSFQMSSAEAATLSQDLSKSERTGAPPAPKDHGTGTQGPGPGQIPSVLPLPLVTEPIQTVSMTDYPDGLAVEMRMDTQAGEQFSRVRIPMFADTARALVGALQQRLGTIGQEEPPPIKPVPS